MQAKVIKFPRNNKEFTLKLYTDEEIDLAVKAFNMFSMLEKNITKRSLQFIDPLHVINCLCMAKINFAFFSIHEHELCNKILETVERVN
jgi:hypothetical protein